MTETPTPTPASTGSSSSWGGVTREPPTMAPAP
jgi:hypothetical protein